MNGITININPVILQFGSFELRWYSLAILTAAIAAILITVKLAARKGISPDSIYSAALWVILGGIIGARLFHVLDRFSYYEMNPGLILQFQQGGLAIWGALVGGGIALVIFTRKQHLPLMPLLDALVPGLLVAQIIGRIGCIINGDAYGGLTSLPWGFIYTNPNALIPPNLLGVPTHPYPVYEMIWNGLALLLILRLQRHYRQDGLVFLTYLACYSLGRFVLTFVRLENTSLWGFQQAQIISLSILAASVLAIAYFLERRKLHEKS